MFRIFTSMISEFIVDVIDALERENIAAFQLLVARIGRWTLNCKIDDEKFYLEVYAGKVRVLHGHGGEGVELAAQSQCVLDLIDGKTNLIDAVYNRSLALSGAPDALTSVSKAVRIFVHGASTSDRIERILSEFRHAVKER